MAALRSTRDLGLTPDYEGKVRDMFDLGDRLLIVATDRISAFDVIMDDIVPGRGVVLNVMSLAWFKRFADVVPNHVITADPTEFPAPFAAHAAHLGGRSVLVRKADRFDVECVVRGYIAGSGWKSYRQDGTICGHVLPAGLKLAEQLPEPIFTPATKAEEGHDENIDFDRMAGVVGAEHAAGPAGHRHEAVRRGRGLRPAPGRDPGRHQVRVRAGGRPHHPHRRGDDPRQQPLLARGRAPARGRSRRAGTSRSCATTWRPWTGTTRRRRRALPAEILEKTSPALPRGPGDPVPGGGGRMAQRTCERRAPRPAERDRQDGPRGPGRSPAEPRLRAGRLGRHRPAPARGRLRGHRRERADRLPGDLRGAGQDPASGGARGHPRAHPRGLRRDGRAGHRAHRPGGGEPLPLRGRPGPAARTRPRRWSRSTSAGPPCCGRAAKNFAAGHRGAPIPPATPN